MKAKRASLVYSVFVWKNARNMKQLEVSNSKASEWEERKRKEDLENPGQEERVGGRQQESPKETPINKMVTL